MEIRKLIAIIPAIMLIGSMTGCSVEDSSRVLEIRQRVINATTNEGTWQQYVTARPGDIIRYMTTVKRTGELKSPVQILNNLAPQVAYITGSTALYNETQGEREVGDDVKGTLFPLDEKGFTFSDSEEEIDIYYDVQVQEDVVFDEKGPVVLNSIEIQGIPEKRSKIDSSRVVVYSSDKEREEVPLGETISISEGMDPIIIQINPNIVFAEVDTAIEIEGIDIGQIAHAQIDEDQELNWHPLENKLYANIPQGMMVGHHSIAIKDKNGKIYQGQFEVQSAGDKPTIENLEVNNGRVWIKGFNLGEVKEIYLGKDIPMKSFQIMNDRLIFAVLPDNHELEVYGVTIPGQYPTEARLIIE